MTSLRFVAWAWVGALGAAAFAQEEKPPVKDNPPPRAERREGERPPPPRREGEAGEGPRRPPEGRPPEGRPPEGRPGEGGPRRDGEMGPPRREGGPPPRGEGDFGPPRGEGFGPAPRRDGDFGPPRRPEGGPGVGPPGLGGRGGMNHLEQDDPEMFAIMQKDHDLERQTFEIAQRLRGAPKTEKEKLKGELAEVVRKHFDIRQERRTLQMKRVEDDLKRLKDQIEARSKARDEIISRRVTELTGEENDLGF